MCEACFVYSYFKLHKTAPYAPYIMMVFLIIVHICYFCSYGALMLERSYLRIWTPPQSRFGSEITQAFIDSTQNKSDNMILQNENAGLLVYKSGKNNINTNCSHAAWFLQHLILSCCNCMDWNLLNNFWSFWILRGFQTHLNMLGFVFSQTRDANLSGQRELAISSSRAALILNNVALSVGILIITVATVIILYAYGIFYWTDVVFFFKCTFSYCNSSMTLWKKWQVLSRPSKEIMYN